MYYSKVHNFPRAHYSPKHTLYKIETNHAYYEQNSYFRNEFIKRPNLRAAQTLKFAIFTFVRLLSQQEGEVILCIPYSQINCLFQEALSPGFPFIYIYTFFSDGVTTRLKNALSTPWSGHYFLSSEITSSSRETGLRKIK